MGKIKQGILGGFKGKVELLLVPHGTAFLI